MFRPRHSHSGQVTHTPHLAYLAPAVVGGEREEEMKVDDILDEGNESWTGEDIRKRLDAAGYAIVPKEPTAEMRRAWVAAHVRDGFDIDEKEPVPGAGQGDLAYAPRWENIWFSLRNSDRYHAMLIAAQHPRQMSGGAG